MLWQGLRHQDPGFIDPRVTPLRWLAIPWGCIHRLPATEMKHNTNAKVMRPPQLYG